MASFDRRAGLGPHVFVVLVALLCAPLTAHAWLEQVVSGHETRVSLDGNGSLLARHQLTLTLRGGPLSKLEIEGIGEDIEILSDAKVTRTKNGNGPGIPLRVTQTEGGALRLEVLGVDGLRSGTYRFDFAYRLDATQRRLLETSGDRAILTWVGPRLSGGVDSAKVVVSIPHAEEPPALPTSRDRAARGVLLGQVLQGSITDEIELLRAHVAVGEPAVWQVEFDRSALSGPLASDPLAPPALMDGPELATRRGPGPWQLGLSLIGLSLIALLVVLKERAVRVLAERTDSRARPLVPAPLWLRAAMAGLAAGGFVALTLLHRATLAMGCGVLLALWLSISRRCARCRLVVLALGSRCLERACARAGRSWYASSKRAPFRASCWRSRSCSWAARWPSPGSRTIARSRFWPFASCSWRRHSF